ncbi:MAG: hypothetical protein AAB516_00415 [Patescibacteria group bacterium]
MGKLGENKSGGNKTGDAIVIVLIWGGLATMLFNFLPSINFPNNSLASAFSVFNPPAESRYYKEIISISKDKENFQNVAFHSENQADIFDIKASVASSDLFFAGSDNGLFVSRNGGLDWYVFSDLEKEIDSSEIYKILTGAEQNNEIFISAFKNNKGVVYKTTDDFFSLEKIFEINDEAVYDFAISGDSLYFGLSDGRILIYSINKKEVSVLTDLGSPIVGLEIRNNGNFIYALLKSGNFLVSENGGKSFSRCKFSDIYRGVKIKMFFVEPTNNFAIYAATNYGLARSYDFGNSWKMLKSIPSEDSAVSALYIDKGEIYAASGEKIYKSRDFGLNWLILDPQIGERVISTIIIDNGRIIVGTKD